MSDTVTCEHCNARCRVTPAHVGKIVSCPKCKNRFVVELQGNPVNGSLPIEQPPVPPVIPPVPLPPPIQNADFNQKIVFQHISRNTTSGKKKTTGSSITRVALFTITGILTGCVTGYFAAHHFAFFGGLLLLGAPYSPARSSLVPGHMLLCGMLLGILGLGLGVVKNRIEK
jgi:hypothetical protein